MTPADDEVLDRPASRTPVADLVRDLGISYRQWDYWCAQGIILHGALTRGRNERPVAKSRQGAGGRLGPGSGRGRRYICPDEAAVVRQAAALIADGLSPRAAFDVARDLAERGVSTLGGVTLRAES